MDSPTSTRQGASAATSTRLNHSFVSTVAIVFQTLPVSRQARCTPAVGARLASVAMCARPPPALRSRRPSSCAPRRISVSRVSPCAPTAGSPSHVRRHALPPPALSIACIVIPPIWQHPVERFGHPCLTPVVVFSSTRERRRQCVLRIKVRLDFGYPSNNCFGFGWICALRNEAWTGHG